MKTLNQKGFAAVEAILVFVIIAIIGGTGFYVYQAHSKTNETLNTANLASQSATVHRLTGAEATAKVQKTYDTYLAAVNKAEKTNAAASPTDSSVQPVQASGLKAVKPYLSADLFKQISPVKAGNDDVGCALYAVDSYKASLLNISKDKKTAVVAVDINAGGSVNGRISVTIDLQTGKITQITCPA